MFAGLCTPSSQLEDPLH
jgi:hypothetical protein